MPRRLILIAPLCFVFALFPRRHVEAYESPRRGMQELLGDVPNLSPTPSPTPRPTTYVDPLCNDGQIKERQRKACRDYGNDGDCCAAFRQGGSCDEGGQFHPGSRFVLILVADASHFVSVSRYDEYCQLTCGFCSAQPTQAPSGPSSLPTNSFSPTTYAPSKSPSEYCGNHDFKSAFPMVCFVFVSTEACCQSFVDDGGCDAGGVFAERGSAAVSLRILILAWKSQAIVTQASMQDSAHDRASIVVRRRRQH